MRESGSSAACRAFAFMLKQLFFAQPNMFRCDFHQFIIINEFQRLFQAHANRWRQQDVFISAGRTDVRQLLAF